jgi:hypothetical protein
LTTSTSSSTASPPKLHLRSSSDSSSTLASPQSPTSPRKAPLTSTSPSFSPTRDYSTGGLRDSISSDKEEHAHPQEPTNEARTSNEPSTKSGNTDIAESAVSTSASTTTVDSTPHVQSEPVPSDQQTEQQKQQQLKNQQVLEDVLQNANTLSDEHIEEIKKFFSGMFNLKFLQTHVHVIEGILFPRPEGVREYIYTESSHTDPTSNKVTKEQGVLEINYKTGTFDVQ